MLIRCVLIDRDKDSREALSRYLERYGISVSEGESGADLERLLGASDHVDIVLMDLVLPDTDSLSLCRRVHAGWPQPLIAITEQGDVVSHVAALESGADDYVDKPYAQREVLARIRAVLRRTALRQTMQPQAPSCRFGALALHDQSRVLKADDGMTVQLTRAEFNLFKAFVRQPGVVLSRAFLMAQISNEISPAAHRLRAVDLTVSRLRHKLNELPALTPQIRTVRGLGYQLVHASLA